MSDPKNDPPSAGPPAKRFPDRVVDVLRSLVGEPGAGATEAPVERGLDEAVRRVTESIDEWRDRRSFFRYVQETAQDRVVRVGHDVDLAVKVEALFRGGPDLTDRVVRFSVDGVAVGEARTGDDGVAHLGFAPDEPGLKRVTYEILSDRGVVQRSVDEDAYGWLQVVQDEPVAIVDATLLTLESGHDVGPLARLAERGWQLCYIDLEEWGRLVDLRARIDELELPPGAILSQPPTERFPAHDVDFRPVFGTLMLRRLRANGVPLVLAVGAAGSGRSYLERLGEVAVATPESLADMLAEERTLDGLQADARALSAEAEGLEPERRLRHALDVMTATRAVPGNEVRFEMDNQRARERVLDAIGAARRSVHLQFYIVQRSDFLEQLIVRLIQRARAGVRVRMVVDALYSGEDVLGFKNAAIRGLRDEPGIELLASDPIRLEGGIGAARMKERDHRKLIVVDGERAFVSGRNASDEYYRGFDEVPIHDFTPHERIPWLDAGVEVSGPLVRELQAGFLANWARNGGGEVEPDGGVLPEPPPAGPHDARMILHDGVADANALASYEAILASAERHVYIVNDFPVLSTLARRMLRAVERGVEVHFLTGCALPRRGDGSFFEGPLHREIFEYLTKKRFEALLRGGVRVYEYAVPPTPNMVARGGAIRPYVHAKVMSADGRVVSVGSANLDATASYWERELNVIVEDPDVALLAERTIRRLIEHSLELDPDSEYWKRESARRAVTGTLWPDVLYS